VHVSSISLCLYLLIMQLQQPDHAATSSNALLAQPAMFSLPAQPQLRLLLLLLLLLLPLLLRTTHSICRLSAFTFKSFGWYRLKLRMPSVITLLKRCAVWPCRQQ
jgi:hypothetical protein